MSPAKTQSVGNEIRKSGLSENYFNPPKGNGSSLIIEPFLSAFDILNTSCFGDKPHCDILKKFYNKSIKINYGFFSLLAVLVIIPFTQIQGSANTMNRLPKQENALKFELLAVRVDLPAKPIIKENNLDTILDELAFCESGKDNSKIGKAGEIGYFQYKISTWNWFNELRGTNLNILSVADQTDMTRWAFENGYKNHWTCAKMI